MKFKDLRELYDYINNSYGVRGMWISDLAIYLGIGRRNANHLVYAAGYRRGKLSPKSSFMYFSNDEGVQNIFKLLQV